FGPNPPVRPVGSSAGMDALQVVFPAWNIGLESQSRLRRAALDTVDYLRLWYDSNDTSSFYPAAADAGYDPKVILRHLRLLVRRIGYSNFAYAMPAGGIENEATVPTTIAAMLLQSYQRNIHVFPDWPKRQDASFGDLLAVGDFRVSSRLTDGQVAYVRIV
ncbi:Trehalose and maltose hydrolase (possible phosphorylase), partial [mine drainage metagenome]